MEEFSRFIDMNIVLRQKASCQSLTRRKLGINISIDALRILILTCPGSGLLSWKEPVEGLVLGPREMHESGERGKEAGEDIHTQQ